MTTLVMGEDRTLTLDLRDTAGLALLVTGWTLEMRIGGVLTKALSADAGVPGRVTCVFGPDDLNAVGAGLVGASIWRTDPGSVTLVAQLNVEVRRVT